MGIIEIKNLSNTDLERMCVIATIDGKGVHIGRIKGISYDADGTPVLDVDIDSVSCVGGGSDVRQENGRR